MMEIKNWVIQIKKGYLDLCILSLIYANQKAYGFQLIGQLAEYGIEIKEGTLYPLLNRMTKDNVLKSNWVLENENDRPRKFYSLTNLGEETLSAMQIEYQNMNETLEAIKNHGGNNGR